MFLSKNLSWESLTKKLVTFNFNIMQVHWDIWFFLGGRVHELKGEGRVLGAWRKRGAGVFCLILEDRVHAMTLPNQLTPKQIKIFQTMTAWLQNSTEKFIKGTTSDSRS